MRRVREGGLPSPEESGILIDREREVRGTYVGVFPEPERAIRGARGVLRVLRGCAVVRKSPPVRARVYRGRRLDCLIVLMVIYIYMLVSMPHLRRCSPHVITVRCDIW